MHGDTANCANILNAMVLDLGALHSSACASGAELARIEAEQLMFKRPSQNDTHTTRAAVNVFLTDFQEVEDTSCYLEGSDHTFLSHSRS